MLLELREGKGRGHWHRILLDEFEDAPKWGAVVWCPGCGKPMLMRDHTVDANDRVHPSLGHPLEYGECGWHTDPYLVGWNPVPPIPVRPVIEHCGKCGRRARSLSGWGTWNGPGLLCPPCFAAMMVAL